MKQFFIILLFGIFMISCTCEQKDWVYLFDGKSFENWHGYNRDTMPKEWTIKDGAMIFTPSKERNWDEGGKNIVTNKEYTSFELSIEWKISEGGNSGIFWGVKESPEYREPYETGPEIQVLDNERHPDATINPKFHQAGALYDLVQPQVDAVKPANEWNHFLIRVDHDKNKGSVKLNGKKIITFPLSGPEWQTLVNRSKFKDWKGFGKYKTGKIGLQDHGDVVSYRKIKIREL